MYLVKQIPLRPGARWLEFTPSMATRIEPNLTEDEIRIIAIKSSHGPSAALEVDGQLLFAAGLFTMSREYTEAWTVISPTLRHRYPILLTRKINQLLDIHVISEGLRSVFMFVESGRKDAQAWAYSLGFKPVGEILNYADPGARSFIFTKEYSHGRSSPIHCHPRISKNGC